MWSRAVGGQAPCWPCGRSRSEGVSIDSRRSDVRATSSWPFGGIGLTVMTFVADAAEREGATGCDRQRHVIGGRRVSQRGSTPGVPPFVIVVPDTTRALQLHRARHVTAGSRGLVSSRSPGALARRRRRSLRRRCWLDQHTMSFAPSRQLEQPHRSSAVADSSFVAGDLTVAVVELGMNHAGRDPDTLVEVSPSQSTRVWTNVAEVHSEFFESVDGNRRRQGGESWSRRRRGVRLVANAADRSGLCPEFRTFPGKVTTFGIDVAGGRSGDRGLR